MKGKTTRRADRVYRSEDDTIRVRVFRRETGRWDFDTWTKSDGIRVETYGPTNGDDFPTARDAMTRAVEMYGRLRAISVALVTEGWEVAS